MTDCMMGNDDTLRRFNFWKRLVLFLLLASGLTQAAGAATLEERYPGLAMGLLRFAVLAPMDDDTLLTAGGITITRPQLQERIQRQDPTMRLQMEKNQVFLIEQEAIRRVLFEEAKKAGIVVGGADENRMIQALFDHHTRNLTVSSEEARAFYDTNAEMVGGVPFEQVAESIRHYLAQEKKQQAVADYIQGLGKSLALRINDHWVETQGRLGLDNPVDRARRSGKATMVEFGATGCVPCDMMQPVLDHLRKNYRTTLNVVFVHVGEEQILSARYGIRSIPVQVFFDAAGKEVFRHVGFFAQGEVTKKLAEMGVTQ